MRQNELQQDCLHDTESNMAGSNTYWNHNGRYEVAYQLLWQQVPISGSVENPRRNPRLERFRKACNCYYDLYNNGLCNRAGQFAKIFGVASSRYGSYADGFVPQLYHNVEQRMDEIVAAAAAEQGIELALELMVA